MQQHDHGVFIVCVWFSQQHDGVLHHCAPACQQHTGRDQTPRPSTKAFRGGICVAEKQEPLLEEAGASAQSWCVQRVLLPINMDGLICTARAAGPGDHGPVMRPVKQH